MREPGIKSKPIKTDDLGRYLPRRVFFEPTKQGIETEQ